MGYWYVLIVVHFASYDSCMILVPSQFNGSSQISHGSFVSKSPDYFTWFSHLNWQFTMWLDCQMAYHLGTLDKFWSGSCKSLGRSESWKWCGWAQSSVHQEPWEHENLVRIEQQLRLEDAKVRGMIFSLFRNIGEILVRFWWDCWLHWLLSP